mmetsp:Transcript_13624/g.39691  ORF Transcript_13624/g.39691 Transcript_13624/m.39691 type:complete len:785 (-) Transcript_13624:37-2391(-)
MRRFATLAEKRAKKALEIAEISEVRQLARLQEALAAGACPVGYHGDGMNRKRAAAETPPALADVCTRDEALGALAAGFATFALHSQARVASALGEGFYTIGPCGEELLAGVGLRLWGDDSVALHYRHLATQIARHARYEAKAGGGRATVAECVPGLLLDRARGYCVSMHDPVTGGAHCALGGGDHDFLVTSTLASQATPAVGRAIAPGLAQHLGVDPAFPPKAVSYVSVGDGSVNNAHFLSGLNTANYITHRGFRCPVLFGVSDNGLCISLRGYDWIDKFKLTVGMPVIECDASELACVFQSTSKAVDTVRRTGRPGLLLFRNLPRRFGHAATDRQQAYLSAKEIQLLEEASPLAGACGRVVAEGLASYSELHAMLENIIAETEHAFEVAAAEPKLSSLGREHVLQRAYPLHAPPTTAEANGIFQSPMTCDQEDTAALGRRGAMRKLMNQGIAESLEKHANLVYLGEDVEHGGYYLVTEGLANRFPGRVRDMPPDETSLLGVGLGLAQGGLLPVVEIPYAKYLDCGADMFHEIVTLQWLNQSPRRQAHGNGMVIRLQGFDKGVFGGNFHTHNSLPLPPGLHVVSFSNGQDWIKGWRHAVQKASEGHIVMVVDSTALLNRRHVHPEQLDGGMLLPKPEPGAMLGFDAVMHHPKVAPGQPDVAVVTYGNGVLAAREAQLELSQDHGLAMQVLEVPCVSSVPKALPEALAEAKAVLFADVCKSAQAPLLHFTAELKAKRVIGKHRDWALVAAANTYNPLGSTITFLSKEDIVSAALGIHGAEGESSS